MRCAAGDGVFLRVPLIDLQRTDAGGVVDSRVLVALYWLTGRAGEGQELHVDLNVVPGHLLLVPLPELHSMLPDVARQAVHPVTFKDVVDCP